MSRRGSKKKKNSGNSQANSAKKRKYSNIQPENEKSEESGQGSDTSSEISGLEFIEESLAVKIPPIVITTNLKTPVQFTKSIIETLDSEAKFKFGKEGLKVFLSDQEKYDKLSTILKNKNIEHFSYALNSEKPKHLVLKGLPNLEIQQILDDLNFQGFKPLKCVKMKMKKPILEAPMFLITFNSDVILNDVRKIRYICSIRIRWDKYRNTRGITQCHNCQEFGHGSSKCFKSPKCVKCPGEHKTAECSKKPEDKPKCVNCKGEHPANYSKCPTYVAKLENLEEIRSKTNKKSSKNVQEKPNSNQFPEPKWQTEKPSLQPKWNDNRTSNSNKNNTTTNNFKANVDDFNTLKNEISELNQICNISKMIEQVRNLKNKLKNCNSEADKLQVFLSVLNDG